MKRFFALLLVALMLLPCLVACGGDPVNTDTSSGTQNSGNTDTGSGSTGGNGGGEEVIKVSSKDTVLDKWKGKTLDVLATVWSSETGEPGAPWSQAELVVKPEDYFSEAKFGLKINASILDRADLIKTKYGVTLNFVNSRVSNISTILSESMMAGYAKYHIAMPRMLEAQTLVQNNTLYDLADSKYIDFTKSYFNDAAYEAYTVGGHTLFAAGDFSFLDEQTSYLMAYNVAMTENIPNFPDLYAKVKAGEWTIKEMTKAASYVSEDMDDQANKWTDNDKYGFGTTNMNRFFQYSGIKQVSVIDGEYAVTLDDEKVSTLISEILQITDSNWARTKWDGDYGAMEAAFGDNRLLFYNEVTQKFDHFTNQSESFKIGVLPCPKLTTDQETYYTPCAYQAVLMCIPKCTTDREMSEYFFDVLSWTGQEYVMKSYKESLKEKLYKPLAEDSMYVLENYIFANLCYDVGFMHGWNGLLSNVQAESYNTGVNKFTDSFGNYSLGASKTVAGWNENWYSYTDSYTPPEE